MNVGNLIKVAKTFVKLHKSELMLGTGVASMAATIVSTHKAATKTNQMIFEAEHEQRRELNNKEKLKLCWKNYIPVALAASANVGSMIGVYKTLNGEKAALVSAYGISEALVEEYRKKLKDIATPKKFEEAENEIATSRVEEINASSERAFDTGQGNDVVYDITMGKRFISSVTILERAKLKVEQELNTFEWCSLNDFYDFIGLPPTTLGESHGWLAKDGAPAIRIGSDIDKKTGSLLVVLAYSVKEI